MDYTDLIARLNNLVILDEVRSDNRLGKETADAIEALVKERDELVTLINNVKTPVEFWVSCNTEFKSAYEALLNMINAALAKLGADKTGEK